MFNEHLEGILVDDIVPLLVSNTRFRFQVNISYCGITIGKNRIYSTYCWLIIGINRTYSTYCCLIKGGGPYCCSTIGQLSNCLPYCCSTIGQMGHCLPYCCSTIGCFPKPCGTQRRTTLQHIVAALFEQSGQVSWAEKKQWLGQSKIDFWTKIHSFDVVYANNGPVYAYRDKTRKELIKGACNQGNTSNWNR